MLKWKYSFQKGNTRIYQHYYTILQKYSFQKRYSHTYIHTHIIIPYSSIVIKSEYYCKKIKDNIQYIATSYRTIYIYRQLSNQNIIAKNTRPKKVILVYCKKIKDNILPPVIVPCINRQLSNQNIIAKNTDRKNNIYIYTYIQHSSKRIRV